MNCSNLIGRLTRDPEVRYTSTNNTMVVQFSIAVNRPYAKPEDEQQADFINIVAWSKTAEFCSKYFKKGMQIGVTGRIQTRNYDDKDGKKVYVTEVVAEHVYFADSKKQADVNSPFYNPNDPFATPLENQSPIEDDDLPF